MSVLIFEFHSRSFNGSVPNAKKKTEVEKPTEERETQLCANYFLRLPADARDKAKSPQLRSASFAFQSRQVIAICKPSWFFTSGLIGCNRVIVGDSRKLPHLFTSLVRRILSETRTG
jgi:hypothetical protein